MPKGDLDAIKAHAEARGESVNGFINRAVKEVMKKENGD
nr:Arc family DNA-binding protein [Flavonifractor plautii]